MPTALARKFRVDVTSDLTLATGWTQVKGIYAFKPSVNPNTVDTSSYETNGWSSFEITMQGWGASLSFFRRTTSGVYDAGQEILRARQGQFGDAARVGARWYDTAGGPEAFQGLAIVEWDRANDGVKDVDAATVKLDGDGVLTFLGANPYSPTSAPVVTSALPSGAAAGAQVTISGQYFTGTLASAGVKFGGVSSATYTVLSDQTIVAVMPAGSAGSAAVTVINATGTSNALPYTRG